MSNEFDDEDWGTSGPTAVAAAPPPPPSLNHFSDENDASCVVNVPTKDIGLVIGRGGSTIRDLEREFGVRLNLDRQTGSVRVSQGNDKSQQECVAKINAILSGSERPSSGFGGGRGRFDAGQSSYAPGGSSESDTISVNAQDIPLIIGRGGSKIQDMERNSGARIKVDRDTMQVIITGTSDCRRAASDLINGICDRRSTSSTGGSTSWDQGGRQQYNNNSSNNYRSGSNYGSNSNNYASQPQQSSSKTSYANNTGPALVESGWDDDDDWGSSAPASSNTASSRQVPQQPYNGRQESNYSNHSSGQSYSNSNSNYDNSSYSSNNNYNSNPYLSSSNGYDRSNYRQQSSSGYDRNQHSSSNYDNRSSYQPSNNNSYDNRQSYSSSSRSNSYQQPSNPQSSGWSGWGNENDDEPNQNAAPKAPAQDNGGLIDWDAAIKQSHEQSLRRWAHLPPVIKNFYKEDPEVAAMLPEEAAEFRKSQNNIMVSNIDPENEDPIPNPVQTFEQAFSDYPDIMEEIRKNKFVNPSPIQSQAWPLLLSGRDTIAIAQTGTGKTLAFLLPAFIHIEGQIQPREQRKGPTVICLCPTRELAQQIYTEVLKYNYHGIRAVCIYGGKGRREQISMCQAGVEIVIATPGRLNDLIQNGFISLESVTYLVLDEADRMLDMGFEPDIRKVLLDIRPDRQSVMTSATWPPGVRKMANRYMKNPSQIYVGSLDLNAVHTVRQMIRFVDEEQKRRVLFEFIAHELRDNEKLLVFCGRKSTCSDVASDLSRNDIPCESIHGDREQQDREDALADFKNSHIRILIATDVASRGLDVLDITHVLNYDFPKDMEEYVHRVGRTGRAGRSGIAISFLTRQDWTKAGDLIKILQDADQEVPHELEEMAERWKKHQEKMSDERAFCESFISGGDGGRRSGGGGRFGGGGGGGFGGGGGGNCYNCNRPGHMSRECPEPRRGGGGGRRF